MKCREARPGVPARAPGAPLEGSQGKRLRCRETGAARGPPKMVFIGCMFACRAAPPTVPPLVCPWRPYAGASSLATRQGRKEGGEDKSTDIHEGSVGLYCGSVAIHIDCVQRQKVWAHRS